MAKGSQLPETTAREAQIRFQTSMGTCTGAHTPTQVCI